METIETATEHDLIKQQHMIDELRAAGSLMVAYSGGIDSAYLAWAAYQVLGDQMLAVIADSASLPRTHLKEAIAFAEEHRIPLQILQTDELEKPDYVRNDALRCFHCKDELFTVMEQACSRQGYRAIAYGRNVDDAGDFRPGQRAATEHHVLAPLATAELRKAEIRRLAHHAGLRIWNKPASACLSSRIQYGQPVTREVLAKVEQAEQSLFEMGYTQLRVRVHDELARIEFSKHELSRAFTQMEQIAQVVRAAGFRFVTIDCEGYRSGSMNDLLPIAAIASAQKR